MDKKRGLLALLLIVMVIVAVIAIQVNEEINAIKHISLVIGDIDIDDVSFEYIVLNLSVVVTNTKVKPIKDFEGNFSVLMLNQSIGNLNFPSIDINPHESIGSSFLLKIFFNDVAQGIIDMLYKLQFSLSIHGSVKGKIFFNMFRYTQPIDLLYVSNE